MTIIGVIKAIISLDKSKAGSAIIAFLGSLFPVVAKKYPFSPLNALVVLLSIVVLCFLAEYFGMATLENVTHMLVGLYLKLS